MIKKVPICVSVNYQEVVKWVSPEAAILLKKVSDRLPDAVARAKKASDDIGAILLAEQSNQLK